MHAVGRPHPLQAPARDFFARRLRENGPPLATSAEVLQELLHAYLPAGRLAAFDGARDLVEALIENVRGVEADDVALARHLVSDWPTLTARDLLHLACCQRRGVREIETFDRGLAAAMSRRRR